MRSPRALVAARQQRATLRASTIVVQSANAVGALAAFVLVTRNVSAPEFAIYSAMMAAYAIANAAVGTAIGISGMAGMSGDADRRLSVQRASGAAGAAFALLVVAGVSFAAHAPLHVAFLAEVALVPWVASEIAGAHALGVGRYRRYAIVHCARVGVWVVSCALGLAITPSSAHLDVALGSLALSAVVPVAYLFRERALVFGVAARRTVPVQALAMAQLGLWLAASADRAVFAHFDPRSAALYAAIYGLLDRIYRTLANASLWGALPTLFARGDAAAERSSGIVRTVCVVASTAVLVAVTPPLVGSLTGGRYRPDYTLTAILATALGLMLLATPLYARALATRRIWPLAFVAAGVGLANLIGNLFVIPRAGTIGAALVTLATYAVWLASLSLFVRNSRALQIDEPASAKRRLDAFRPQGASR